MFGLGQERSWASGQSMSALPLMSDVDLLGNGKGIVNLNAEVSNRAFDLAVPKTQLYGSQIARAGRDQCRQPTPRQAEHIAWSSCSG